MPIDNRQAILTKRASTCPDLGILGADAKRRMAGIINDLRNAGISADMSFGDRGLQGAMKGADRVAADGVARN